MKIQELTMTGKVRDVPPLKVTEEFWQKLQKYPIARKRFRVLENPEVIKEQPKEKQPKKQPPKEAQNK